MADPRKGETADSFLFLTVASRAGHGRPKDTAADYR
jgi:hypothetical protein